MDLIKNYENRMIEINDEKYDFSEKKEISKSFMKDFMESSKEERDAFSELHNISFYGEGPCNGFIKIKFEERPYTIPMFIMGKEDLSLAFDFAKEAIKDNNPFDKGLLSEEMLTQTKFRPYAKEFIEHLSDEKNFEYINIDIEKDKVYIDFENVVSTAVYNCEQFDFEDIIPEEILDQSDDFYGIETRPITKAGKVIGIALIADYKYEVESDEPVYENYPIYNCYFNEEERNKINELIQSFEKKYSIIINNPDLSKKAEELYSEYRHTIKYIHAENLGEPVYDEAGEPVYRAVIDKTQSSEVHKRYQDMGLDLRSLKGPYIDKIAAMVECESLNKTKDILSVVSNMEAKSSNIEASKEKIDIAKKEQENLDKNNSVVK